MNTTIDHRSLYRLPWSVSDNVIAWLEPTAKCNLACEGCYRENVAAHKSMSDIRGDLDVFERFRLFDGVSIAGGDPLTHPEVVEIVAEVSRRGHKPVLNTNGLALTDELLKELKQAGLVGFTFHVDSKQGRPGWKNKGELELNELRLQLAEQVARVGGISVAFNSTVYQDTLEVVPELVRFAEEHIDLIHVMVFITYRAAVVDAQFDYYLGKEQIDPEPLKYATSAPQQRLNISSREVAAKIAERFPDFAPCAYLGGTHKADSLKWLLTGRIGLPGKIMGYVGPKFMEISQTLNHLVRDRYLAYVPPSVLALGRPMLAAAAFDRQVRSTLANYLAYLAQHPLSATQPLHFQSIMIIQPIDLLADGRQNMCDGCPDLTVHDGELVWSCRLEEKLRFGQFVRTVPSAEETMAQ